MSAWIEFEDGFINLDKIIYICLDNKENKITFMNINGNGKEFYYEYKTKQEAEQSFKVIIDFMRQKK